MGLSELYTRLEQEALPINQALQSALDRLPAPARPAAEHIFSAGGKRLRPFLTVLFAHIGGYREPRVYDLAGTLEMLHAATLLHDDVLDRALTRRGRPAAHTIYGISETILAGDALLALGNLIVAEFKQPALSAIYSQATMDTACGEILEMSSLHIPDLSHERYLEFARGKTACLIGNACAMGAAVAYVSADMVKAARTYGENLGLAFQLVDDALDFATESETGKPRGGDLREGKLTPPLRLYRAALSPESRAKFDKRFIEGSFTEAEVEDICNAVGPFAAQSLSLADDCLNRAREAVADLPSNPDTELLIHMAEYVRNRTK